MLLFKIATSFQPLMVCMVVMGRGGSLLSAGFPTDHCGAEVDHIYKCKKNMRLKIKKKHRCLYITPDVQVQ